MRTRLINFYYDNQINISVFTLFISLVLFVCICMCYYNASVILSIFLVLLLAAISYVTSQREVLEFEKAAEFNKNNIKEDGFEDVEHYEMESFSFLKDKK